MPLGLFSSTSRQYIFWEDLENPIVSIVAPYANTWGDTVPAPPPPQPRTSDEKVPSHPAQICRSSEGSSTGPVRMSAPPPAEALQDDIRALEPVCLQASSDSYTTGAFRKEGGLIYVECDGVKVYQACIRSPGQLASMKPELRSERSASPQDAQRDVVPKALEYYRKLGLLTEDNKPVLPPAADSTKAEVDEQLRPSLMKPSACEAIVMAVQKDYYYDGPWLEKSKDALLRPLRELGGRGALELLEPPPGKMCCATEGGW